MYSGAGQQSDPDLANSQILIEPNRCGWSPETYGASLTTLYCSLRQTHALTFAPRIGEMEGLSRTYEDIYAQLEIDDHGLRRGRPRKMFLAESEGAASAPACPAHQ